MEPPRRLEGRARAALRDGAADARGDAEPQPRPAPTRRFARWEPRSAAEDGFEPVRVAVYFGEAGETVPDPFFGGEGPGAHRLHPVRRLHDRLPPRREEHARPELPVARRAARRPRRARHRGHLGAAGAGRRLRRRGAAGRVLVPRGASGSAARNVVFAGGVLGTIPLLLKLRASPDGLPGLSAAPRRRRAEQLGGAHRRDHAAQRPGRLAGRRHHEHPPHGRALPPRAGPLPGGIGLLPAAHGPARLRREPGGALRPHASRPWPGARWRTCGPGSSATGRGPRSSSSTCGPSRGTMRLRPRPSAAASPRACRSGAAPTANMPEATDLAERVARQHRRRPDARS